MTVTVALRKPDHRDALAMIAASETELASLYAPEHRTALSPHQLEEAGVVFMVAYDDTVPVGCGGYAPLDEYAELKRIFSLKAVRGRGVGASIVGALEDHARVAGFALMLLETGEASPDAIALYSKIGYVRRGPFGPYLENGSSVFMEKPL